MPSPDRARGGLQVRALRILAPDFAAVDTWQMVQDGAVIYVCGDASWKEPDVHRALTEIYQAKTGAHAKEGEDWLSLMEQTNRYVSVTRAAT
jgi:hypothetical protein